MRDALESWASITLAVALVGITICPPVSAGERWSRQLTEFTGGPVAGNDWIPLSRPSSERQAGARVLNYFTAPQQTFLDPDSAAQAQQHHFTFLNHQFPQSNRFLLQQPAPQQHQPAQELLEQPFHLTSFQRTSPFVGQTIQHPPPPPPPQPAASAIPFEQQFLSKSPVSEALIQEEKQQHQQQQQTSLLDQPFSYQHIRQPELDAHPAGPQSGPSGGAVSQEEVQLLYVPVETLYNQKQSQPPPENTRFNTLPQPVSPSLINDFYTAGTTTTTPKPPRTNAATFAPRYTSAPETPAPALSRSSTSTLGGASSKPKPNQPPLALFLYNDGRQGKLSTGDALGGLKNINEIAVLDAFGKNTPKVFIGPSGLAPSKSYSRFDLPYLSSVDLSSNRANRKIEDLPFFVAPLSYKTPNGYSKIALPPPHVGSIIVRQGSSSNGNSLDHNTFHTRPTAPSNVQYYTPSTLNFDDSSTSTKTPVTLGASGKPIYETDHYTSPTGKPVSSSSTNDRGVAHFGSFSNPNPLPASRHPSVNEEYFNLAKTKKPTTSSALAPTTPNYPFRSYGSTRQFDFKPMPDQKIPPSFYPQEEDDASTTLSATTTTTERPTTAQLQFEAERMRTHFREENFRSRRPHHHQPTTPASLDENKPQEQQQQQQFVHKFKLVDSVRPNNVKSSVVDHGFLDFFNHASHQHTDDMIKTTITTNLPGGADRQVIRNNYFTASAAANEDTGANRHSKFVSTYYNPSSTAAGTTAETTTPATFTTQDMFFREFDHRSKFYEREPKYETSFPTTVGTTGTNYINKYKYDTGSFSDAPRYSVEVVTTSEPTTGTAEPTQGTTDPQHYNIPSELPPISANLPGLVNALMDDQWPPKASEIGSAAVNPRGPHFRKQLHRTTTQTSAAEPYGTEPATTTTRRPLQRQRRPHPSRTTPAPAAPAETGENSGPSTRAPNSRSRSRYVPNNEERTSSRGRSRSRTTTPRGPRREEENLDYQRDVLKQNYPVIRPQGPGASAPTTTPPSTTIATTPSTTFGNQEPYEETSERLIATTLANEIPLDSVDPQQQVTSKYSTYYSDSTYERESSATTVLPSQTSSYYVPLYSTRSQTGDRPEEEEYLRPQEVLPLNPDAEPAHAVIPLGTQTPVTEASPQTAPPVQYLPEKEESEEKLTTAYGQPLDDAMELKKMEITPRPRRPGLVSRQRDSQQSYASRTTTERTTTTRTTTPEPAVSGTGSRTASGRRPAFVRRPSRLYATTTVSPITTAGYSNEQQQSTHGTNTVRTKNRQDILRGRTRRPTTTTEPAAAAATTASPEAPVTRAFGRGSNLRRISPTLRSRQEQTAAATTQQPSTAAPSSSGPRFRIRERTRFNLQPQESQWSTKLNQNSFQPVLKSESRTNDLEQENVSTEPEPEIVTAARDNEMFFLNVSSKYGQKDSSNQGVNAEDSTETSVPSFADLLNDVMKDFIDDNSQKKPERDSDEKDQASTEEQRRPVASFRNNFLRKRGRSKVVDSFETAESQHINQAAQVYNGPSHFGESLKSIDHVGLSGKNAAQQNNAKHADQQEAFEEQENTAQEEEATVAPVEIVPGEIATEEVSVEVITRFAEAEPSTTSTPSTTTMKPTQEVPTLASLEQTSTSVPQQQDRVEAATETPTTVEPVYDDESSFLADDQFVKKQAPGGIFADVKKTISDLYEMAEHDAETEEMVDGGEPAGIDETEDDDFQPTDDPRSLGDSFDAQASPVTDISPSETQFVQVTAEPPTFINPMGSLVIPTSVSNGITHETEICYRGRCIKTEDDKRKRKFKLN
ncbi:mucin-12 [Anopheles stephensi]|uniref:mucin-12 n=1 Tax=Anopheles stephensi TaxID=30069 RepID=UPI001658C02D|nr:mucin-12 [Anopheles stephensi]XP_035904550.1 mucin-12 [Anopheles stephensi]